MDRLSQTKGRVKTSIACVQDEKKDFYGCRRLKSYLENNIAKARSDSRILHFFNSRVSWTNFEPFDTGFKGIIKILLLSLRYLRILLYYSLSIQNMIQHE